MTTTPHHHPFPQQTTIQSPTNCPCCKSLCLGASLLPCGHILCRRCLRNILQLPRTDVCCPQCGESLHLPKDKTLTVRDVIQQHVSADPAMEYLVLKDLEKAGDLRCLNCKNKTAFNVCLDCQDCYCEICSVNHLRGQNGTDHVLYLLPRALQNTSSSSSSSSSSHSFSFSTVSSSSLPKSSSGLPCVSSMDSRRSLDVDLHQQSRDASRDKSGGRGSEGGGGGGGGKGCEGWVKKETDLLDQACQGHEDMETTLEEILSLGQQMLSRVKNHRTLLQAYKQHLPISDLTPAIDLSSDVRDSDDVSMEVLEKRLRDVREDHHCPDVSMLKRILMQFTGLEQRSSEAEEEDKADSPLTHQEKTTLPPPPSPLPSSSTTTTTTITTTPLPQPSLTPQEDTLPTIAPRVDLMTSTPQLDYELSPKAAQDRRNPMITIMVSLPDNRLVMIDDNNHNVKAMDLHPPSSLLTSPEIPEALWDLAALSEDLVGVTTDKPLIYLLRVTSESLEVELRVRTVRQYDGIAGHREGLLIVCCGQSSQGPASVDVVSREGEVVRTLSCVKLDVPLFMCSSGEEHVLVSDWSLDVVHKIEVGSGKVVQTFSYARMMHPLQVCEDEEGNVYVVCGNVQCVMVRSRDGRWRRLLTTSQHSDPRKSFPRGVCRTRAGQLVVSWGDRKNDSGSCSVVVCYKLT